MAKADLNRCSTLFATRDSEPQIIKRDNFISISVTKIRIPIKLIVIAHVGK